MSVPLTKYPGEINLTPAQDKAKAASDKGRNTMPDDRMRTQKAGATPDPTSKGRRGK